MASGNLWRWPAGLYQYVPFHSSQLCQTWGDSQPKEAPQDPDHSIGKASLSASRGCLQTARGAVRPSVLGCATPGAPGPGGGPGGNSTPAARRPGGPASSVRCAFPALTSARCQRRPRQEGPGPNGWSGCPHGTRALSGGHARGWREAAAGDATEKPGKRSWSRRPHHLRSARQPSVPASRSRAREGALARSARIGRPRSPAGTSAPPSRRRRGRGGGTERGEGP